MQYSRDNRELDLLLFREVCEIVSRVDRVLSRPGGSLLLAGRSGVGRHTATYLVSHMHGCTLFTPKVSRGYSLKHFSSDLKAVRLVPFNTQQWAEHMMMFLYAYAWGIPVE